MVLYLRDVIRDPTLLRIEFDLVCPVCHESLAGEHPMEPRYIDDKRVHEDCYFGELGKEVEQHPIGPGIRFR